MRRINSQGAMSRSSSQQRTVLSLSRRTWLKLSAAALASFVPLGSLRAADPASARVKRLVLLFSPNGTIYDNWKPTGGTTDFKLSPILAPLEPLRSKIIVVDGLQKKDQGGDHHQTGMAKTWTGSLLVGNDFGTGAYNKALPNSMSIDQAVANDIAAKGNPPLSFNSLELGVQTTSRDDLGPAWRQMIYSGPGQQRPPQNDPYAMFDSLFAGPAASTQTELDQIRAEDRSVIDRVVGDLTTLSGAMGTTDRHKLDEHLTSIRAIEQRLSATVPTCDTTSVRTAATNRLDIKANDNFPALVKLTSDILVLALKCDLTRVASIQWSVAVGNVIHKWAGPLPSSGTGSEPGLSAVGHHESSHNDGNPDHIAYLTRVNTWYAQQVAYLLTQLDAVQEGGFTLLDNCLVAYGNELCRGGAHTIDHLPFVLAGSAGGAIKPGRFLTSDGDLHNRLLVSLGQAMGLNITKFGTDDDGKGPLPGLL
jgi:hypothetical protein